MSGINRSRRGRGWPWIVMSVVALAGCAASSSLTNMWRDPEASNEPLRSVVVVAMLHDEPMRRTWEDRFVHELEQRNVDGIASYRLFPSAAPDTNQIQELVTSRQVDGIISIHRLPTETETHYVTGYSTVEPYAHYNYWRGYYQTRYAEVYNPGYVETNEIVRYQADVSRTGDAGGLIWTGITETIDPRSSKQVNHEVSELIVPELTKSGILAKRVGIASQ
jgi:hypothetical protein